MPFEILEQDGYFQLRLFGVVVEEDLLRAGVLVQEIEARPGGAQNRITDLTSVDEIVIGFPEVLAAAQRRTAAPLVSHIKSAFIARQPIHVGYARMFQTLNENPNIELRVVETLEEALRWFASG